MLKTEILQLFRLIRAGGCEKFFKNRLGFKTVMGITLFG